MISGHRRHGISDALDIGDGPLQLCIGVGNFPGNGRVGFRVGLQLGAHQFSLSIVQGLAQGVDLVPGLTWRTRRGPDLLGVLLGGVGSTGFVPGEYLRMGLWRQAAA